MNFEFYKIFELFVFYELWLPVTSYYQAISTQFTQVLETFVFFLVRGSKDNFLGKLAICFKAHRNVNAHLKKGIVESQIFFLSSFLNFFINLNLLNTPKINFNVYSSYTCFIFQTSVAKVSSKLSDIIIRCLCRSLNRLLQCEIFLFAREHGRCFSEQNGRI